MFLKAARIAGTTRTQTIRLGDDAWTCTCKQGARQSFDCNLKHENKDILRCINLIHVVYVLTMLAYF